MSKDNLKFLKRKQLVYEFICSDEYVPMKHKQLAAIFMVRKQDRENFAEVINSLVEDGVISCDGRGLYHRSEFNDAEGVFLGYGGGTYGFVRIEGMSEDVFVSPQRLNGAIHGDVVRVRLIYRPGRRTEGEILKILERKYDIISGIFVEVGGRAFVKPDVYKITDFIEVKDVPEDIFVGDRVMVRVRKTKREENTYLKGEIVSIFGHEGNPKDDISAIVKMYCLEDEFDKKTLDEAAHVSLSVEPEELEGRLDLRAVPTVTIDGVDTKDYDDAVTLEFDGANYKLGVHIADVSHYVRQGSALDITARNRTQSIYMPDRVVPMLPFELSNGICSLNEGVDRLTLSCIMTIDKNGVIVDHNICPSVINVDHRMTYDDVSAIINNESDELREKYADFTDCFMLMNELAKLLADNARKKGALDIGVSDIRVTLNDEGKPVHFEKEGNDVAHGIIEQFMIAANTTVAEHFYWLEIPFLYRVHGEPDPNSIENFEEFLNIMGYSLGLRGEKATNHDFIRLYDRIKDDPKAETIRRASVRAMRKATYGTKCTGHFGLGLTYYTHFTSPIRRYCDLFIHRIIKMYLISGEVPKEYADKADSVAFKINLKDKDAAEAMRDGIKYEAAYYMEDHVGEEYNAMITTIMGQGVYVVIDDVIEGLIPEKYLDEHYDIADNMFSIIKRSDNSVLNIGDFIRVKVVKSDKNRRCIDLALCEV